MMVISAPAIKAAFRSFGVPTQTAKVRCFRCCHFLISAGHVSLATRSGATTRMRWASKLSNRRSAMAVREMTVFQDPYRAGLLPQDVSQYNQWHMLIIMRCEVHQSFLQSVRCYQLHRHESPKSEGACALPFAMGVGILPASLILQRQTSHQVIR